MATFKIYRNNHWDIATPEEILKLYNAKEEDIDKIKVYVGDNKYIKLREFKNFNN